MKIVFKLKVILLLVLIFISANIGLKASHIIGAEINYKHVEGNSYLFTLKVYRDCNECKFDNNGGGNNGNNCPEVPNLKVKGALNTFYGGQDFGEVVMTRTRIEDQTPVCYTSISKCKNGSTMNYGFELQEFQGTFNFTGLLLTGKCEFDVSIAMSSRNASINSSVTEQNFFNYASLNLCNGIKNQSTRFELTPVFTLLQNQTHSIALGIMNDDNDSLSFKLKSALVNRSINVTYSFGRSYTRPYTVYCSSGVNCPPSPNAPLAEGFYVSNQTGDVVFTPTMLNEGGVIVVECEEWKKDNNGKPFLAGVTRRDIYAEVVAATNNLPKIKNNELAIDRCEGQPFTYKLNIDDFKMYGTWDSVQVNIISDLSDMLLKNTVLGLAPYNFYDLELKNTLNKRGQHFITVNATDNNCPIRGTNAKTILLNILKNRTLDYNYKTKNCGLLQVENKLKNQEVRWTLCNINNQVLKSQVGIGFTYQLTTGGKYILKGGLDATGDLCGVNITDTIVIEEFKKPELEMGPNHTVCKGILMEIVPVIFNTYDKFKVYLDNKEIQFPYSYKAVEYKKFSFNIMQDNGCFVEDYLIVDVHPDLTREFGNEVICSNFTGTFDLDNVIKADRNKINYIDLSSPNPEVSLDKIDNLNWGLKIVLPGKKRLSFTSVITDKNGCSYLDTFYLDMQDPKPIDVVLSDKICANAGAMTLPAGVNGSWECITYPDNIKGNQLFIQPPYAGSIELRYTEINTCTNTKEFTVNIIDTATIALSGNKNLIVCENAAPINLKATPANGKWEGSFVNQDIFYPLSARNTKNLIKYRYTNQEGCISNDNLTIEVVGLPALTVESNKSSICVGDELKLNANSGLTSFDGYWVSNGDGRFDNPGKSSTTYIPSVNDIKKGIVNFTYTIQTNSVCGNVSEGIDIAIIETPSGKIIPDYSINKCEPAQFKFATDFTNITKQDWYINDSLTEEFEYAFSYDVVLKAGTYRIKTRVMNGECAAEAYSQPIEVYPTPATYFVSNPNYKLSREYPRIYLKDITKNKYPFTSKWYFNNNLIDESKEFYYNVETASDTFSIKLVNVSSVGGCENSQTRQFIFTPINQLYIPDAFSPDTKGPDENNEFRIKGPPMQFFYIEVYNKWGGMVYFSRDMNSSWDGTYGGKPALPGVYFYKINSTDMDGLSRDYSGTVTLIR